MHWRAPTWTVRFALIAVLPMLSAQQDAAAAGNEESPPRIEIVGASVSAGFVDGPLTGGSSDNRSVPLLRVVQSWLGDTEVQVRSSADLMLFQDAEGRAPRQIERALKRDPQLALAVDFLFWFGYGYVRKGEDGEQAARLRRLELGLELLDRLPCPIVVGDLPDVHGAERRMISPRQIPDVEILDALNARLAAWAAERPRVRVFPLRALVAEMKEKGVALPCAEGAVQVRPGGLMQGDKLHATRLGMAYLGFVLQDHVRAALPEAERAFVPAAAFEAFVQAADAGADLELMAEATAPAGR
ncbi:MAG: hypothetical protein AB7O97_11020 [Planctomycetota bacterium]